MKLIKAFLERIVNRSVDDVMVIFHKTIQRLEQVEISKLEEAQRKQLAVERVSAEVVDALNEANRARDVRAKLADIVAV